MSTQGVMIIRNDGTEKAMHILHDAYPGGAGVDIIDLIKTTDLDTLYDCMTACDDMELAEDSNVSDPEPFSYIVCRLAGKTRKRLWISPAAQEEIRDSLFCEYAYVIDLDNEQLMFFVGCQTKPQKGNPYGTAARKPYGMAKDYYPCRLAAVFPFQYIKIAKADHTAHEMEMAAKHKEGIRRYRTDMLTAGITAGTDDYTVQKDNLMADLNTVNERIATLINAMTAICLTSNLRVRELEADVKAVSSAADKLEKRIAIIN